MRIQDFRGISNLCIPLGRTTVLVGANNSGKTTVLRALDIALGDARPSDDDFQVTPHGSRLSEFVIDVKIAPAGLEQEFGDALTVRFGTAVQLPTGGAQFVAMRTKASETEDGSGPAVERRFLGGWSCDRTQAAQLPTLERPNRDHLKSISYFLLDARRDIIEEIRQRRSYWGRLLADVGIEDADKAALEEQLKTLGEEVVAKSSILSTLHTELDRIRHALGSTVSSVSIEALPARVDEVARAVDVLLQAEASAALPLRVQGLGSRSLAVVMVFQAFTQARLGAGEDVPPLPFAAFEEPEAHLHPHPQRAMFDIIANLPGQRLVTTHSPHITQVADIFDLRVLRRDGADIRCRWIPPLDAAGSPTFSADALPLVRRFLQKNNGETLFARCVVLYEGDTEDGAIPEFARLRWGIEPSAHGVSMLEVGGAGNFKHLVPALEMLGIPWVMLIDGDAAGTSCKTAVEGQLGRASTNDEVFQLAGGAALEQHLINLGFQDQLQQAIAALHGPMALTDYRTTMHGQNLSKTAVRDYQSAGWQDRLLLDYCKGNLKNSHAGREVAAHMHASVAEGHKPQIPNEIKTLLDRVDVLISLEVDP